MENPFPEGYTSTKCETQDDMNMPSTACQRKRTVCRRRREMTESQLRLKRQQDRDAQGRRRQRIRESHERIEYLEKVAVEMKREYVYI